MPEPREVKTACFQQLSARRPVCDPLTGHTDCARGDGPELDDRPVAISASDDGTVRVWDLARQRAMRHHLRRVQLRHAAPVLAAVLHPMPEHVNVITGCEVPR